MNAADKQLAAGLVSLGMDPAQAASYAAERSAEPGRKASSLGERLYVAFNKAMADDNGWAPFATRPGLDRQVYERAAVTFTASLTYAESEGVREALLSSVLLSHIRAADEFLVSFFGPVDPADRASWSDAEARSIHDALTGAIAQAEAGRG